MSLPISSATGREGDGQPFVSPLREAIFWEGVSRGMLPLSVTPLFARVVLLIPLDAGDAKRRRNPALLRDRPRHPWCHRPSVAQTRGGGSSSRPLASSVRRRRSRLQV